MSYKKKPQKQSNIFKRLTHMGIFLFVTAKVILDSHSIKLKPVWWPRNSAPSSRWSRSDTQASVAPSCGLFR